MTPIIAIGDIHGDHSKLLKVLTRLRQKYDLHSTQIVTLGDVVDGAYQTSKCIETLMSLGDNTVHLLGNHEDLMLNALDYRRSLCYPQIQPSNFSLWYNQGGYETAVSYGFRDHAHADRVNTIRALIPTRHVTWLKKHPLTFETKSFIFVHAGLSPHSTAEETSDMDKLWIRDEFINSDYNWGKRVVYGHTVNKSGPLVLTNKIGLDTMHHGHGELTSAVLDDDTGDVIEFITSA